MNEEINEKVLKYETFINDVLKEDLKEVHNQLERKTTDLAEWVQLKTILNNFEEMEMTEGFKTKMDIGTNIYVQVNVPDASKIMINIGSGIFVEYTINEALKVVEKRIDLLNKQIAIIRKNSAQIKARIKLVLHGIQELTYLHYPIPLGHTLRNLSNNSDSRICSIEGLILRAECTLITTYYGGGFLWGQHKTKLVKMFIAVKINSEFHRKGIQRLQQMFEKAAF